jgi:hypothetical protein
MPPESRENKVLTSKSSSSPFALSSEHAEHARSIEGLCSKLIYRIPFLCALGLLIFTSPTWTQNTQETIEISERTDQVNARFYFVERLTNTIQSLYRLHTVCKLEIPNEIITSLKKLKPFENTLVQKHFNDLITTKSLQPLFVCWQQIITYKHISDPVLSREFSQLVHTVIHKLVLHSKSPEIVRLKQLSQDTEDPLISTHHVCFRFYLLKRLMHVPELFNVHHNEILDSLPMDLIFIHPRTAECYATMQTSLSIKPIEKLLEEIRQYRFIDDTLLIHEFLRLVFITLATIKQEHQNAPQITHSFEHVTSFSITELLEAIDIKINEIKHIPEGKAKSIPLFIEETFDFSPNCFANYVYRRYYFIHRLERIMGLFQEINRSMQLNASSVSVHMNECPHPPFNPETIFNFQNSFPFKHNKIKESIHNMEHEHNLKPLFLVWDEFITYKSVEDQLFVEEFTKEIFVISRNILICTGICARHLPSPRSTIGLAADQLLDVIDMYVDQFLEHKPEYNSANLETSLDPIRMPDLHQSVHIDDVALRYYHIQRLGVVFWLLNQIRAKAIPIQFSYSSTPDGVLIDSKHQFKHEYIVSCIKVMEQTNSVEPLMGLMQGVQKYKYIDDELFAREYLTLLLVTLQHLELRSPEIRLPAKASSITDDLPLERILDALDLIAQELPALLEKYEFHSEYTWKEWLKKYWWAPAMIAGTITFKILMMLKKSGFWAKPNKPTPNFPILDEIEDEEIAPRPKPSWSHL